MDYQKLAEQFMIKSFAKEPPFTPPEDMSKGEVGILTYLTFFHSNVLSGELAKGLRLSSGRVAIALKSLERKGLVRREEDAKDRRKVVVNATPAGKKIATKQKEQALMELVNMFDYLGEDDTKELIRLYDRLLEMKK